MGRPSVIRRLGLALYDCLGFAVLGALVSLGFPRAAFAYIDPSVMTYTIQALAGVTVALSAVFGVMFRRGRKAICRLLAIEEHRNRTVEPDVHRVGAACVLEVEACEVEVPGVAEGLEAAVVPEADDALEAFEVPAESEAPRRRFLDRGPGEGRARVRFAYALVVAAFFVITFFFAAPLEIMAGSVSSLIFGAQDVWWVLIGPDLGIILLLALGLTALRGRAFDLALALLWALGICGYIQALFLNGGLPAADGATIHWGDYMAMQVVSAGIWLAVIVAAVFYGLHNRQRARGIEVLSAAALATIQLLGLLMLMVINPLMQGAVGEEAPSGGEVVTTEEGLFTVNPQDNVIVFVLDTFDDAYLKRILKTDPQLLDEFTGFTSYENCTGAMIPTRFAIPFLLTGEMPQEGEAFSQYKAERYERSEFLDQIADAGYSLGIYTDSLTIGELPQAEQRAITDKTLNMHDLPNSVIDYGGALYSLYQMGLYREAPWALKWAFWYYTDEINNRMAHFDPQAAPEETIYLIDDVRYYDRLRAIGLSVEDDAPQGAFRFIHLLGSHYPFTYDENGTDVGEDNSNVFRQSRGTLAMVSEYLRQLKALGLYDSATIIVTADHGYWTITEEPIDQPSTPIMFVKPSQNAQEAAAPLVVSDKPVSQLDLQATILDALGLDFSDYSRRGDYAGFSMFEEIDPDRLRYYLTTDSLPDLTETQFREYVIEGNALDFDNWSETGRFIDAWE